MPKPSQIPTYASPSFLVYRDAVPDVDDWSFVVYQTEGGAEKRRKDMERYRRGRLARAGVKMGVAVFIVAFVMLIFSLASETTVASMVLGACAWVVLMIPFFVMEEPCYRLARIEALHVRWAIQDRNPTFSSTVIDAALDPPLAVQREGGGPGFHAGAERRRRDRGDRPRRTCTRERFDPGCQRPRHRRDHRRRGSLPEEPGPYGPNRPRASRT